MRFGARVHDFGKGTVEELAPQIAAKGFSCVQLALAKAITNIDSGLGRLNPGLAYHIGSVFSQNQLQIAVLGCYINMIHPDPTERRKLIERFKEHIRYARDFGASIVGTETGSLNADYSSHPGNDSEEAFQSLLPVVAELVAEAEKFGVFVCIEGVASHTVTTNAKMKRVLETIQSNNLQVIFDPVNLITAANHQEQDRIINEAFEWFGEKIITIHAKDFIIENGKKKIVPVGQGWLNYELFLKTLKTRKPYINLMLEDARPETAAASMQFLNELDQVI